AKDTPKFFFNQGEKRNFVYDPSEVKKVSCDGLIPSDFYGNSHNNKMGLPGPFMEIEPGKTYKIDPRKL
ncbi:MAG: right-handed parallel beta-helix repeat-containing protein, partial [Clostridiales bacterium]|nr:right-handed parallel beta-helix repeat-containing protein [Clostridiales bacterium]